MKALVVYDSKFGNTERIAQVIGNALGSAYEVEVLQVGTIMPDQIEGLKLLIVGSPTQRFNPTGGIKNFLQSLPSSGLEGIKVAAFDTRLTIEDIEEVAILSFFVRIFGYAAKPIGNGLKRKGGELILPPEGFYVQGMEGPLVEGEVERAENWARQILATQ
ncbi:MAG: nitric oxide synthase [Anaerolineae bacterium SM23_ 63]|nr:MAG: nitric oxide synthase [Anaerolineae bacterium SM23_ 63]HEY47518.1 flavodoxin family protein [Anaerolineae bacterium]